MNKQDIKCCVLIAIGSVMGARYTYAFINQDWGEALIYLIIFCLAYYPFMFLTWEYNKFRFNNLKWYQRVVGG